MDEKLDVGSGTLWEIQLLPIDLFFDSKTQVFDTVYFLLMNNECVLYGKWITYQLSLYSMRYGYQTVDASILLCFSSTRDIVLK